MKLTAPQILEIIKKPKNTSVLKLAVEHEERLRMHTEPILEFNNAPSAVKNFLGWVASFLPPDKFERFSKLLTFPIETVNTTKEIFDEYSKIFNAPDQSIDSEFSIPEYKQDFSTYLTSINNDTFWEGTGLDAMKTSINSFVVIDLPTQQSSFLPEPYFYLLDIRSVFDVEINALTKKVEYIIFWQNNGSLMCYEETHFRNFIRPDSGDWKLNYEIEHSRYETFTDATNNVISYGKYISGLGYTPVASFWNTTIKGSNHINKSSPITRMLSKLDWLIFWKTSQKYFQLYASYPIVVTYSSECEYRDKDGNECNEGYITYTYEDAANNGKMCTSQKKCPVCEKRGVIGAGSFWEVDPPLDKNDTDMMQNPVKIIEIGTDLLDFGVKEIIRIEKEITVGCTGFVKEVTAQAANEKDVESRYETRKAILDDIRKEFENTELFARDTMGRLRYGNYYLNSTVHYGKEYFLQTTEDISNQLKQAKTNGLPAYEIARIRNNYSQTRFKNDEQQYRRQYILSLLEPYPDCTAMELKTYCIDVKDPVLFELKLDFANFVARFEMEQMNVVEFGSLINFNIKIKTIKQKLLDYAKERTDPRKQLDSGSTTGNTV